MRLLQNVTFPVKSFSVLLAITILTFAFSSTNEKQGGYICVESEKGTGSSFRFSLPVGKKINHGDTENTKKHGEINSVPPW